MKKVFYRIIYYWHVFKAKELSIIIPGCIDEQLKSKLLSKFEYYERSMRNMQKPRKGRRIDGHAVRIYMHHSLKTFK